MPIRRHEGFKEQQYISNTVKSAPSLEMHILSLPLNFLVCPWQFHSIASLLRKEGLNVCFFSIFYVILTFNMTPLIYSLEPIFFFCFSLIFLGYIAVSPFPCQRVFHYLIKSVGRPLDCLSFLILKCYHVHFNACFPINMYKRFLG